MSTYHVEILHLVGEQTDSTHRSRESARRRRWDLQVRGHLAQVVKGSGRLVIDAMGVER